MAERRMFAKSVIDSDIFLEMPLSTQALYFHLAMRADDDGFVNNPKRILRMVNASDDDMKVLLEKQFLIPFETGIVVIRHWKMHNYIQKDRYKPTIYENEKKSLNTTKNGVYESMYTSCIQNGYSMDTQDRIGKDRIGKVINKKESKPKRGYEVAICEYTANENLQKALIEFIKMRKLIKKPMTDRALKQLMTKLDKLGHCDGEKIAILDQSIMNSWQGVFELKEPYQETAEERRSREALEQKKEIDWKKVPF